MPEWIWILAIGIQNKSRVCRVYSKAPQALQERALDPGIQRRSGPWMVFLRMPSISMETWAISILNKSRPCRACFKTPSVLRAGRQVSLAVDLVPIPSKIPATCLPICPISTKMSVVWLPTAWTICSPCLPIVRALKEPDWIILWFIESPICKTCFPGIVSWRRPIWVDGTQGLFKMPGACLVTVISSIPTRSQIGIRQLCRMPVICLPAQHPLTDPCRVGTPEMWRPSRDLCCQPEASTRTR